MFQGIRHTSLFPEARGVLSGCIFFFMGHAVCMAVPAAGCLFVAIRCPFAARSLPARRPTRCRPPSAWSAHAGARGRSVWAESSSSSGRQSQARFEPWVAHLCARGGRWRAQNSPGAHRSHGAHGGRAASWEQWRAGIAWGGISSRVARRRLELLEKLGDGAGAGVGGGAEAALRGAATRWLVPHGRVVLHARALPLHLPREGFDRLGGVTRTL